MKVEVLPWKVTLRNFEGGTGGLAGMGFMSSWAWAWAWAAAVRARVRVRVVRSFMGIRVHR